MRNPFRFTVDPRDGQVIVADVGNNNWEEINRGGPARNFGWPCYEGPYEAATYANCDAYKSGASPITQAIYSYPHSVSNPMRGSAIGGDLYLGTAFPALYRGAYFYQDFNGGVVDFLTFNGDGSANDHEFATNVPGVVQMTVGDDGAMYVSPSSWAASGAFATPPAATSHRRPMRPPTRGRYGAAGRHLLEQAQHRPREEHRRLPVGLWRRGDQQQGQPDLHLRRERRLHGCAHGDRLGRRHGQRLAADCGRQFAAGRRKSWNRATAPNSASGKR